MSGFDRLGRELEYAAERGPTPSWSRRAGNAGGAAAIAAALATVAVIAGGAVVLLHGRSGGATSPASSAYTQGAPGAQVAAWTRLLKCPGSTKPNRLGLTGAGVTLSNAAPDPRLVARLGVLRGPWTAADEAPAAKCPGFVGFLGQTVDIRYVRYVGPGVKGGQVFLVPGRVNLPPLPPLPRRLRLLLTRARRTFLSADVCLITVGAPAPASDRCTPLSLIEHPFPLTLGALPVPARLPLAAQAPRVCEKILVRHPAEPGKCIALPRLVGVPPPAPLVTTGVVHDGIASVDVYAGFGHRSKSLLFDVPVHNNVYAFVPFAHVAGPLTLVFRDAQGRVVPTTAIPAGIGKAISTIGPLLRPPPVLGRDALRGRATIPLIRPGP